MTRAMPSTEDPVRLIFARHGETEWNKHVRFRGRADVALNDVGMDQARRIARRLSSVPVAAIYASPLGRTIKTATPIAAAHGLAIVPEEALIDFDYGAWQGKTPAEVADSDAARYQRWLTDPARVRIPQGETLGRVRDRVLRAIRHIARRHPRDTVVVVSHDMIGRVLVVGLLGLPLAAIWRIGQDNGALSVFESRKNSWSVISVNDTGHLAGSESTDRDDRQIVRDPVQIEAVS